jgi:outer membrane protein OmpA-like peptidoglycan-associated protein
MNMKRILIVALTAAVVASGCAKPWTDTEKGAAIGAGAGAAVGALATKNRTKGALIGAVGGGLVGAAVGNYMDKQKQDLDKALAKERESGSINVTKLENHSVKITMTGQTAFETGSTSIKPAFNTTMDKLADIVNRYGKTSLTVVGHTDHKGTTEGNQKLSEARAHAVGQYLRDKGVKDVRVVEIGKGEVEPIASNDTEEGRRMNRRVEILVEPVVAN